MRENPLGSSHRKLPANEFRRGQNLGTIASDLLFSISLKSNLTLKRSWFRVKRLLRFFRTVNYHVAVDMCSESRSLLSLAQYAVNSSA